MAYAPSVGTVSVALTVDPDGTGVAEEGDCETTAAPSGVRTSNCANPGSPSGSMYFVQTVIERDTPSPSSGDEMVGRTGAPLTTVNVVAALSADCSGVPSHLIIPSLLFACIVYVPAGNAGEGVLVDACGAHVEGVVSQPTWLPVTVCTIAPAAFLMIQ